MANSVAEVAVVPLFALDHRPRIKRTRTLSAFSVLGPPFGLARKRYWKPHCHAKDIRKKVFEGRLSFHGELLARHFTALPLDPNVLAVHTQIGDLSCVPMAVEFVLKLLGRVPPNFFALQQDWINRSGGALEFNDFRVFNGQILYGVRFRSNYTPPVRGGGFPLEELFSIVDDELLARRYVIVSLTVPGGWHNYIIYNRLPNAEYEAVTKAQHPEHIANVRQRVIDMEGTDILTYELIN